MSRTASADLHAINGRLRKALAHLRTTRDGLGSAQPEDFSSLRADLEAGLRCLLCLPEKSTADAALDEEIAAYRGNLEELVNTLPVVHARLQTRRQRLESALGHLQAVADWAQASRDSF